MTNDPRQNEILTAKLHPQRVLGTLLNRSQVLDKLVRSGQHPKLTVITAPAGYGKSTLMYQLMCRWEVENELVAWLSLDENDNNLDVFSTYIVRSYNECIKNSHFTNKTHQLPDLSNANPKERLALLFNKIENLNTPVTIILDDFHVLSNIKLLKFVEWLLDSMPFNMSLMVGSRVSPNINNIPNLKAKNNIDEIDINSLKFTLQECRDFFIKEKSVALSEESIKSLYTKTEGWVAALQLVFLALKDQENPEDFVNEFSGIDRDIVSYLGSCVLAQIDTEIREFMMKTSILERMNGELCTLLTGVDDAASIIEEQERAGLFIFAIDRNNKWYRYHHLFRELLLSQFLDSEPELYIELCLRTASWYEKHEQINEAIEYYLKGKHYEYAAELIAKLASQLVQFQGQHETYFTWVNELPSQYINSKPEILICYIWSLTFTRRFKDVRVVLDSFNSYLDSIKTTNEENYKKINSDYVNYSLQMLCFVKDALSGNHNAARIKSEKWLEKWKETPLFERGTVLGALSAACTHTLEFEMARQKLMEASKAFYDCQAGYGVSWMDSIYAIVCIRQGYLNEARDVLEKSLLRSNKEMGEHSYSSAMLNLGLAFVYYELNDIEKSNKLINKAFLYIDEHGLPDTTIAAYKTRARLLALENKFDDAFAVLLEGERFGREQHISNFESTLALERGRLLLKLDRVEAAKAIYCDHNFDQLDNRDKPLTAFEIILVKTFHVRLLIAQNEIGEASLSLKKLISECRSKGCHSLLIHLLILNARVLAENNQMLKALRTLEQAIQLAVPENRLRTFIDEKQHLEVTLLNLVKARATNPVTDDNKNTTEFLTQLCQYLNIESNLEQQDVDGKTDIKDMAESLTKRELEILNLLSQGLTNKQLADSLFVSLPTIKWHLSNIYGKLGVKNKVQAIKLAQDFK